MAAQNGSLGRLYGNTRFCLPGIGVSVCGGDAAPGKIGEYIKDSAGSWVAGYTARINLDPEKELPEWLTRGKQIIGGDCPW